MDKSDNTAIILNLWRSVDTATLGTIEKNGRPYLSLITLASFRDGCAALLLSDLARHTINLKENPNCSLLLTELQGFSGSDPLTTSRITVAGSAQPIPSNKSDIYRTEFLAVHPTSIQYIDFSDFSLYLFQPEEIHLVGGFGRIVTVEADILVESKA